MYQFILDHIESELLIAVDEENMGLKDIREGLVLSPFLDARTDVSESPQGCRLKFLDKTLNIGRGESQEQINQKLDTLPQRQAEQRMSITGAAGLAGTIKDRINAAKDKIAQVTANTDGALAKLNDAADRGDRIAKQIEQEAEDLNSQLGQFTNE